MKYNDGKIKNKVACTSIVRFFLKKSIYFRDDQSRSRDNVVLMFIRCPRVTFGFMSGLKRACCVHALCV